MGVKSLWDLLTPVGRPVLLETMEGKSMAIDSSIWIYQFQATMRDKEGRALVNAHVLGFLRRICKLLFYGIKPVFVFDGGAPAMKRNTLSERKRKKAGAAESHARVAEKLLAAQLRRKAVEQAQHFGKSKSKAPARIMDGDTVYLEDIDGSAPQTPVKVANKPKSNDPSPSSNKKSSRFHDHDPYKLPDLNMDDIVASVTRSTAPDPRLATEEELCTFIEEMRPEDFDITSPAFRELPTEVQYEIIGDLRLKSRQTSYDRLQNMLRNSRTPLDFSRQQIKNLKQRNALTQQLLVTTDSIGHAHIAIPVRIASERNKEYVLLKNQGEDGGWVLGIRDEGTQDKPIQIDQDEKPLDGEGDSDTEMEEVDIAPTASMDSDLREFRRGMALSAIAKRQSPMKMSTRIVKPKKKASFEPEEPEQGPEGDSDKDSELAIAMQESLEHAENAELQRALQVSRDEHRRLILSDGVAASSSSASGSGASPSVIRRSDPSSPKKPSSSAWDIDDLYASPSRLETALSIGNVPIRSTRPSLAQASRAEPAPSSSLFGQPSLLLPSGGVPSTRSSPSLADEKESDVYAGEDQVPKQPDPLPVTESPNNLAVALSSDSEDEMEAVIVPVTNASTADASSAVPMDVAQDYSFSSPEPSAPQPVDETLRIRAIMEVEEIATNTAPSQYDLSGHELSVDDMDEGEGSPSPVPEAPSDEPITLATRPRSSSPANEDDTAPYLDEPKAIDEEWDAVQEMDSTAEEGEFARFLSQVKGRDLSDIRNEIDAEIKALNQQRKIAMRDSEDITHQMVAQIMTMLRLFGIPYITAPMEAEAQCAELVRLELVDGIITDDSDVFLFGGLRVFKNMFNQSKTVECFLLSDLTRELGLDRDKLVRLAYLLGSDYVEGLPRAGPVVAMELLTEFPGEDGLHKFKDWWTKVQSGQDNDADNKSNFRKRFKRRFKDLYLPPEWPNPAVRDAYYHPTVDSSEEPFKWGLPDLDALRGFLHEELGWGQSKVDDLLLPIIQKVGKRGQTTALNRQGNLNSFFDVTAGSGTYAPRKRQAYTSKRLQEVVKTFRDQRSKSKDIASVSASPSPPDEIEEAEGAGEAPAPKRRRATRTKDGTGQGKVAKRGVGSRGRGGRAALSKRRKKTVKSDDEDNDGSDFAGQGQPGSNDVEGEQLLGMKLRPRPQSAHQGTGRSSAEAVAEYNDA
ncbi:PIN domain-like protein [Neolentinus lepideus HHB14362 ss-1]|uniref:PIN domain-like protein n=1 Tax=Neolentinus lepideus HHB14362 ss-1 TaxID=1314782 RepID=A0A165VJ75_9AGAM|nr:PIN domain-like protein [Neolentinus lepideus HHB14362 ss-1]